MTSSPTPSPDSLHARDVAVRDFVDAWGRMGSVWGISRTMAEVHALLYITGDAMCADDIMAWLEISRGNASMSLRALVDWGVVTRSHRRGDRKDYFVAEQDVWSIVRAIVRERKKREIDPLLVSLHEIRDHARSSDAAPPPAEIDARLDSMLTLLEMASELADRFMGPSGPDLKLAASMLSSASFDDTAGRASAEPSSEGGTRDP